MQWKDHAPRINTWYRAVTPPTLVEEVMLDRDWNIQRAGRTWTHDEFDQRADLRPEKLEIWEGKLLWTDEERVALAGLLIENLGADRIVRLGDPAFWRAALGDL
jgi:hypothetical protein